MADSTVWWLLAGAAVAIELTTGTFYLVMVALGMAAAAVAAHVGVASPGQLVTAGLVGGGAVAVWHVLRGRQPRGPDVHANRDVNLDIGEHVQVEAWNADGTGHTKYRGAQWTVVAAPGSPPVAGLHRVREVHGNRLVVEKI